MFICAAYVNVCVDDASRLRVRAEAMVYSMQDRRGEVGRS